MTADLAIRDQPHESFSFESVDADSSPFQIGNGLSGPASPGQEGSEIGAYVSAFSVHCQGTAEARLRILCAATGLRGHGPIIPEFSGRSLPQGGRDGLSWTGPRARRGVRPSGVDPFCNPIPCVKGKLAACPTSGIVCEAGEI